MELKSDRVSAFLNDPVPISKSRLGIPTASLLPYSPEARYVVIPRKKSGKLDDVSSNRWLDEMRSSSPPRKKTMKDRNIESASTNLDSAYSSWMLEHPSAIKFFRHITEQSSNRKLAIFLDYDGTLSPIVDDPDCALMSEDMRVAVKNVAKHFPTAIITGRSRDKVYEFVGLTELYYAGSHGMDMMGPLYNMFEDHPISVKSTNLQGMDKNTFQPAIEFLPIIDEVVRTLIERTVDIKGAKVENHKFCASVHYRNVDEKLWHTVAQCVNDVLINYPRLQLTHGRKVLEIRPMIDWNKGKAVEFLLNSLGLSDGNDALPIYIGDDRSDEDAFKMLQERDCGFGILVSSVPKETKAVYSLRDPSEVMEFLKSLVRWKMDSVGSEQNAQLYKD